MTVCKLISSAGRTCVFEWMRKVAAQATTLATTDAPYTTAGPRKIAYSTPPTDGPKMKAACNVLAFQATAFEKYSTGTNCGRSARLAGQLKQRTTPSRSSTA